MNPVVEDALDVLEATTDRFHDQLREQRAVIEALSRSMGRTASERDDIEADLLVACWRACQREGVEDPTSFVRRTLKNAALDSVRGRRTWDPLTDHEDPRAHD